MNLSDNEIIKALECCASSDIICEKCPCNDGNGKCSDASEMLKGALRAINCLKDESNKYRHKTQMQKGELTRLYEENNRQKAENDDLFLKLNGVMLSVDKWLDGDELKQDEVNRAATMREKTLRIVEKKQTEIERLEFSNEHWNDWEVKCRAIKEFAERLKGKGVRIDIINKSVVTVGMIDNLAKEMTEQ